MRSHEIQILQLTDFFTGLVAYENRELDTSDAKASIIEKTKQITGYQLTRSTLLKEPKFNIFRWSPQVNE